MEGGKFFIIEKNRKFLKTLSIGRDILVWFVHAMVECASSHVIGLHTKLKEM